MSASNSQSDAYVQRLKTYWSARIPQLLARGYSFQEALETINAVNETAALKISRIPPQPPQFREVAIQLLKDYGYPGAPADTYPSWEKDIVVAFLWNPISGDLEIVSSAIFVDRQTSMLCFQGFFYCDVFPCQNCLSRVAPLRMYVQRDDMQESEHQPTDAVNPTSIFPGSDSHETRTPTRNSASYETILRPPKSSRTWLSCHIVFGETLPTTTGGFSGTMTCKDLYSQLKGLAVASLGIHDHTDIDKGACQNDILPLFTTFAELDSLVCQLQLIFPTLDPKDACTTVRGWTSAIQKLLSEVKQIRDANKFRNQDTSSAHEIHRLNVKVVTINFRDCAKDFRAELEKLELHLKPSLGLFPCCPNQREGWESPTNTTSIIQQEHVTTPTDSSSTDQSIQCNIRTQEAENYRQELKIARLDIEKLKLLQLEGKQATSPTEAETTIQGLIRKRREMKDDEHNEHDELAILDLEYRLGQIQMDRGHYQNAEITARGVYDKRKELHMSGASEDDFRLSRKQVCEALRGQKTRAKLKEAEIMYREVWDKDVILPMPYGGLLPFDPRRWRLENGHNLGIVLGEQEKFRPAEDQHREVMAEQKEILGKAHADTAQSAIEVIHSLFKQPEIVGLQSKILELVEPIWQSSAKARETSSLVLSCGHKLGETYHRNAEYAYASTVLSDVWKARKKVSPPDSGDAMSTAKLLILSLDAIGRIQEVATVGDWIWETYQAHPQAGFSIAPEEFQVYVCSLFRQEKFAKAALVSEAEWKTCSKRHNSSIPHESTLNACYFYGAAVSQVQQTTTQDASSAIAAVQGTWRLLPAPKLSEISAVKIHYLYAYMLYSMSNDASGASDVLSKVWAIKKTVRLAQEPQRTVISPAFAGILECCFLWAHIRVDKGKHPKAKELLQYGRKHAKHGSEIHQRFSDAENKGISHRTERNLPSFLWFL